LVVIVGLRDGARRIPVLVFFRFSPPRATSPHSVASARSIELGRKILRKLWS
jgi:hypothetical protein